MLRNISLTQRMIGLISICLLLVSGVGAQDKENSGRIKGLIADRKGTVVANNKIIFENETAKFEATSDEKGLFELKLPAGIYQVTTEKVDGFEPIKLSKIRIRPDKSTNLNIQLVATDDAACEVKPASPPAKNRSTEKKSQP